MRILMIAPACYPVNGAEAIVNMKLLQTFAKAEDVTIDLISRNNSYTYPSDKIESYGVKINEMHLVEYVPHMNIATWWRMLKSLVLFRIAFFDSVWAVEALPIVKKLVKQYRYDFILTKNAPSYLLGAYLKRNGVKWVASWNDPFPSNFYPYPYGQGKDCKGTRKERKIIKLMREADYHVFPTLQLQEHMRAYLRVPTEHCFVIPHAVLRDKKETETRERQKTPSDGILRIIHSGNLYGHRNPLSFFEAVNNVIENNPNYRISITILGKIDNKFLPELETMPKLKGCISILPPVEYQQSLSLLDDYDIACVIEAPCKEGEAVFLPTKVTDFMQKGIPIIAISPREGVLHHLYKSGNIGYYGDVSDTSSIELEIVRMYKDFSNGGLKENAIDNSFYSDSVVEAYRQIAEKCKKS